MSHTSFVDEPKKVVSVMKLASPGDTSASLAGANSVRWLLIAGGAWAALCFYMMTAHLTDGHTKDFGVQWMAGRIVADGQGRRLYDPDYQEGVLRKQHDQPVVDKMQIKVIGGWLSYPPVQAILYTPLGILSPSAAQWWIVQLSLGAVIVTALALSRSINGAVPASVAILTLLLQPAFFSNIALGQNAAVTLAIIVVGWCLLVHGKDVSAGLVWGLLAFKPTWGLAICWVPLVTKHPKAYWGLMTSGLFLVMLSIVVCGGDAWGNWLEIARKIETGYSLDPTWVWMRRDLVGLGQHIFGQFSPLVSWGVSGMVALVTAVTLRKSSASVSGGLGGSLLFSAIVLTCPKFIYYDVLMATPAFLLAFSEWKTRTRTAGIVLMILAIGFFGAFAFDFGAWPLCWPLETASTLGLWLWSIALILMRAPVGQGPEARKEPA